MFVGASVNLITSSIMLEVCSAKPDTYIDAEPGDFGWLRASTSGLCDRRCRFDQKSPNLKHPGTRPPRLRRARARREVTHLYTLPSNPLYRRCNEQFITRMCYAAEASTARAQLPPARTPSLLEARRGSATGLASAVMILAPLRQVQWTVAGPISAIGIFGILGDL